MNLSEQHRVTKRHLERSAVVYVRQSDPSQVRENTESTALQRGLREKAIELGWPAPKLVEDDLGITASGFAERPGFQWMLAQVTLRKESSSASKPRAYRATRRTGRSCSSCAGTSTL